MTPYRVGDVVTTGKDAATNYLADGLSGYNAFTLAGWNDQAGTISDTGNLSEFTTPIFSYDAVGSYTYTHDFVLDDDLTTLSDQTVTFSVYIRKPAGQTSGRIRIYDSASRYSYYPITTSTEFQRFTGTKTLGTNPTRIFVMIDSTGGGPIEFHSPQLEISSAATPFLNTATVLAITEHGNVHLDTALFSTTQITDPLYIVNAEVDSESYLLDNFKINQLESMNEHCQYPGSGGLAIPSSDLVSNANPIAANNEIANTEAEDVCSKSLEGCTIRNNARHFGGFPGTGRTVPRA